MFAKFFSIYFMLGSLMPGTNFSDMTHLPDMLDHYQLHVRDAAARSETYSFFRFINDHFVNPDKHAQDGHDQEHKNLPLHSFTTSVFFLSGFEFVDLERDQDEPCVQQFFQEPFSTVSTKGIFQPPI